MPRRGSAPTVARLDRSSTERAREHHSKVTSGGVCQCADRISDAYFDRAQSNRHLIQRACLGDLGGVRSMIADGFDPATPNEGSAENILTSIITLLEWESTDGCSPQVIEKFRHYKTDARHAIVRELILLGVPVGPTNAEETRFTPLSAAAIAPDTEMVRILLDAGADPNAIALNEEEPPHPHDNESLLDFAMSFYLDDLWREPFPEPVPDSSIDHRLAELDRLAVKYGRRRPDTLLLMRARGAKTIEEIRAGQPSGRAARSVGATGVDRR